MEIRHKNLDENGDVLSRKYGSFDFSFWVTRNAPGDRCSIRWKRDLAGETDVQGKTLP
jgi:hypothetical protein